MDEPNGLEEQKRAIAAGLDLVDGMGPSEASRFLGVSEGTILRWRKGDIRLPLRNPAKRNLLEAVRRPDQPPRVHERQVAGSIGDPDIMGATSSELIDALTATEDRKAFFAALGARQVCNALLSAARDRRWSREKVGAAIDAANEFFERPAGHPPTPMP